MKLRQNDEFDENEYIKEHFSRTLELCKLQQLYFFNWKHQENALSYSKMS